MRPPRRRAALVLPVLTVVLAGCESTSDKGTSSGRGEVANLSVPEGEPIEFESRWLTEKLLMMPGTFPPHEAEGYVLPFMADHVQLFEGKRVLEIGTGSGIISLYAAQLGAASVISTDINPRAIESVKLNAERMGLGAVIDARLVPPSDLSAYSVIGDSEQFDTIISNPPYALDLDANRNTELVDKGELGPSIVRGLDRHLAPGGVAALFYNTLFYHGLMVKFARYSGWHVRTHAAQGLSPWALEALFNMYLQRFLEHERLPPDAFRFYQEELPYATTAVSGDLRPLVGDGEKSPKRYTGFMTIQRKPPK